MENFLNSTLCQGLDGNHFTRGSHLLPSMLCLLDRCIYLNGEETILLPSPPTTPCSKLQSQKKEPWDVFQTAVGRSSSSETVNSLVAFNVEMLVAELPEAFPTSTASVQVSWRS